MLNGLLAICMVLMLGGASVSAEACGLCCEGKPGASCASGVCTPGILAPAGILPDRTGALPPAGVILPPDARHHSAPAVPAIQLADTGM
jgi:hypothetical protein